jgi:hypothetical protein
MTPSNPNTMIPVQVGKRTFDTFIDNFGNQRFLLNTVVKEFVDETIKANESWVEDRRSYKEPYNLDSLEVSFLNGKHSEDDMLMFFTACGLSVDELTNMYYFYNLPVVNPVWEVTHFTRLSQRAVQEFMVLLGDPCDSSEDRAVKFIDSIVGGGQWEMDGDDFVAGTHSINRALEYYSRFHYNATLLDVKAEGNTSDELRNFLANVALADVGLL